MEKLIYLDNAATTKTRPEVVEAMLPYFTEYYGNPSSVYTFSSESKKAVTNAREIIAKSLGAKTNEIYFTAGGSESDNWALVATAEAYSAKGKHIITSKIEHHAILHTCQYLEKRGYEVTYLDVDENGVVKLDELKKAIRPDTILVSTMYVNNEVGAVEPVEEISRVIKAKNPSALYHVDAIQAYGKYVIRPKKQGIDLLSVSSHKIHGPKGVGFLYIRSGVKIKPLIYGGGQQAGMRSGTENVPGVAGFGAAVKEMYTDHAEKIQKLIGLKDYMTDRLGEIEGTVINSKKGEASAPQIVSVSFEGVRSEVLLHALEDKGIYVSSGSACSSNHPGISGTLKGIGVAQKLLDSTIRISFSIFNTKEEVDYTIDVLKELVPVLRRYQRG
mgnify:CR=1 FL=1